MTEVALIACMIAVVSGCQRLASYNDSSYQHILVEEEAHLTEDVSSPYCDFTLDYSCLNEKDDSIAGVINRVIQQEFFRGLVGKEFLAFPLLLKRSRSPQERREELQHRAQSRARA